METSIFLEQRQGSRQTRCQMILKWSQEIDGKNVDSIKTLNGEFSFVVPYMFVINPSDTTKKKVKSTDLTLTQDGENYFTAKQTFPVTGEKITYNSDIIQKPIIKTAELDLTVNDESNNPVKDANATIKKLSSDSTVATGVTDSNGKALQNK